MTDIQFQPGDVVLHKLTETDCKVISAGEGDRGPYVQLKHRMYKDMRCPPDQCTLISQGPHAKWRFNQ